MQPVASLNVLWESYRCIHNMSEIISYQLGGIVNTINGSSGDVTSIAVTNATNTFKDVPVFDLSLKEIQEKLTEAIQSDKITADKAHDEMTAVLNLLDQIYTFTNQAVLSLEALGLITIPKA